jgi:nitrogen fixation-related uncharacterized protein
MASSHEQVEAAPTGFGARLKKIGLVVASALVTINIWTGAPLFSVWVGSKLQESSTNLSMGAVFAVIGILAALVALLAWLLGNINAAYDDLTRRPHKHRQTSPWLRSMRGERDRDVREQAGISPIERMVVISVVLAALAFEVWFFFFAGSSLPNQ